MSEPQPEQPPLEPMPAAEPSVTPPPIVRPPANRPPRVNVDLDDETEREIEAALAEIDTDDLMARRAPAKSPPAPGRPGAPPAARLGQPAASAGQPRSAPKPTAKDGIRRGRVLAVRSDCIFVDLGGKSEGVIATEQFEEGPPAVGSEVEVLVDHYDAAEGLIVLRRPGAAQEADWSNIHEGMIVEGRVTAANKAGLVVEISGIRAFMPASQIDLARVSDLEGYVGQSIRCQVSEVKRSERNVILSRRSLLEAEREAAREQTWGSLAEGQVRTGTVRTVKDFGAFVDLGGVDGLVPVREMSWTRVEDPNEIVRPGQQVQVKVLKIDRDMRKVTLGLKQLKASPWDTLEQRVPLGTTVTGRVMKLMDFGAFVEIEPGIEGLVHISELAHHHVRRVRDVVQEGQEIQVRVLKIDPEQRRIALSHKATLAHPEEVAGPEEPAADEPPQPPKPPRKTPLKGGLG